jgi:hypothetical protein
MKRKLPIHYKGKKRYPLGIIVFIIVLLRTAKVYGRYRIR